MSRNQWIRIGQGLLLIVWWCGALFGGAGLLRWDRVLICTALYIGSMIATGIVVRRRNSGLIEQRERGVHRESMAFDKVFMGLFLPLAAVLPAVAGLDAVRFGWDTMPFWTVYPGIGLFAASATLI